MVTFLVFFIHKYSSVATDPDRTWATNHFCVWIVSRSEPNTEPREIFVLKPQYLNLKVRHWQLMLDGSIIVWQVLSRLAAERLQGLACNGVSKGAHPALKTEFVVNARHKEMVYVSCDIQPLLGALRSPSLRSLGW